PLTTTERPSDAAVKQFLSIVDDPAKQPVYVHCAGGQHRTGVMTAVYRMTKYGWSEDRAYDDMKQHKFETFIGHPELRHFVHDFYEKLVPVASSLVAAAALPAVSSSIAGQPSRRFGPFSPPRVARSRPGSAWWRGAFAVVASPAG